MRSCFFTFASHRRIPHANFQAIMRLGFKVGYSKDGYISFERMQPSRSSIISLFDLIGFTDDEPWESLQSVLPDYLEGEDSVIPSLETFTHCNLSSSASFEILCAGRGEEMKDAPAEGLLNHPVPSNELDIQFEEDSNLQIKDEHFQEDFGGCERDEGKQKPVEEGIGHLRNSYRENSEKQGVRQDEVEEKNMMESSNKPRRDKGTNEEQAEKEEKVNSYVNSASAIQEEDEEDNDEEGGEVVSTFMFDKGIFELFRKLFKNSRAFECVKTSQESKGRVSLSVTNRKFTEDINEFRRTVDVKKIRGLEEDLSQLVLSLTSQFNEQVVLELHQSMKLLTITSSRDIFKKIKLVHPHYF